MRSAIFLDRDGTINIDDSGYISNPEDIHPFPFASEAIRIFNDMGFYVFIVTNQSGVARGLYTLDDVEKINNKLLSDLKKENAHVDDVFVSPFHNKGIIEPYNIDHISRKPKIGLFKEAQNIYDFKIKTSFMIGDKYTDIQFGHNAGLNTILVTTGNGRKQFINNRDRWELMPDYVCDNLLTAAKLIKSINQ